VTTKEHNVEITRTTIVLVIGPYICAASIVIGVIVVAAVVVIIIIIVIIICIICNNNYEMRTKRTFLLTI